jgi:benzoyl-CoA 2,3-dioxygenase component B
MGPMLKEEAYHMGTGITGLRRIAKAGVIPAHIQQKYYNKWISGSLDLFGTDHSGSAQWAYTWGIKGRVDEDKTGDPVDKEHLNERARRQFHDEISGTVARVNEVAAGETKLYVPDLRFNRKIGDFAGARYTTDGRKITEEEWEAYAPSVLPTPDDDAKLTEYFKNPNWIAPKGSLA